jgi:Protein of unknown function (DUF1579)
MAHGSRSEHERLEVLIGIWKTEGSTREAPGIAPTTIKAVDTYEWLPGGFGLLHSVDARVGDEKVEGAEIIGYDPDRQCYVTQYFGSDGPGAYEASLSDESGAVVWRMRSKTERFSGTFSDDRSTITGHWELLDEDSNWRPWMDITLTRQPS